MYSIVNFIELSPKALCEYIHTKFHPQIRHAFTVVRLYIHQEYPCVCNCSTQYALIRLLFVKMEEEVEQIFRKESLILFPLIIEQQQEGIQAHWNEGLFQWLENYHQKIQQMLDKIRRLSHNYTVHPDTAPEKKLLVAELYNLDTNIQNWVRMEQGVLFPKMQQVIASFARPDTEFDELSMTKSQ